MTKPVQIIYIVTDSTTWKKDKHLCIVCICVYPCMHIIFSGIIREDFADEVNVVITSEMSETGGFRVEDTANALGIRWVFKESRSTASYLHSEGFRFL